jgi:hypothetical protein
MFDGLHARRGGEYALREPGLDAASTKLCQEVRRPEASAASQVGEGGGMIGKRRRAPRRYLRCGDLGHVRSGQWVFGATGPALPSGD